MTVRLDQQALAKWQLQRYPCVGTGLDREQTYLSGLEVCLERSCRPWVGSRCVFGVLSAGGGADDGHLCGWFKQRPTGSRRKSSNAACAPTRAQQAGYAIRTVTEETKGRERKDNVTRVGGVGGRGPQTGSNPKSSNGGWTRLWGFGWSFSGKRQSCAPGQHPVLRTQQWVAA